MPDTNTTDSNVNEFTRIIGAIFSVLSPVFGVLESTIVLKRATVIGEVSPFLSENDIVVNETGLDFTRCRDRLKKIGRKQFDLFLEDYLAGIIYIVQKLIGNILDESLLEVIETSGRDPKIIIEKSLSLRVKESQVNVSSKQVY